jgi:hypothetical protein
MQDVPVPISHREVIRRLGGFKVVSEALGKRRNTVVKWGARGIPGIYWPDIADLAAQKRVAGITPYTLKSMARG